MQILVLGMHRSGTSATARLINLMGAYFAPEGASLGFNKDNPKGFWERRDVMRLNDALLEAQRCRWNRLTGWQFSEAGNAPQELRRTMRSLILEMDAHRPWFIKDPRLCLTLPAWLPLLEAPVAVIVYRDPAEIARSLHTRDALPPEYGLALWEYYAAGLLNATRGIPRLFVRYAALLEKPVKTCQALHKQLLEYGARRLTMPSGHEIRAFIDPALYRARAAEGIALSPAQSALAEMLQGAPQKGPLEISGPSKTLIDAGLP